MTNPEPSAASSEIKYAHFAESRLLRETDADQVVDLYRRAFGDSRPIDAQEVLSWLKDPSIDSSSLRVLERDGIAVGFGNVTIAGTEVTLYVAAPDTWPPFLEWAEQTARVNRALRVATVSYAGTELPAAAAARGYQFLDSMYTMEISLEEGAPAVSPLPAGVRLSTYREEDADQLRHLLNEVFADDPFSSELATAEEFTEQFVVARDMDPSLWLLAWRDHELVAFVIAYPGYFGDPSIGFIHSLGVRPSWRGRGIGEALSRQAFNAFHRRGLHAVRLGVEASNDTALRLYERLGMVAVRRADHWTLELDT